MCVSVNLVDDRLDVEHVVTLDILDVGGPAIVGWRVSEVYRIAALELRHGPRHQVNFRAIKIVDALTAGAVGPLVRGVLVGPSGRSTMGLDDLEDGIHADILVGHDYRAVVKRIAHQKFWIDAAAAVELGQID